MRILILAIYHDPEPIPKTGELARYLLQRGHQVQVVTAFPHYPSSELYPGYRLALWRREVRAGVPVLRTFIYPYHGSNAVLRMVNYISWMLSGMLASVLTPRCDVMYVWHPPLTVGVTAWVLRVLKGAPIVLDLQDLWPESALASGLMREGRVVTWLHRLADWVYARADRILVVSAHARRHLESRGVPAEKIRVAKHWVTASPPLPASEGEAVRQEYTLGRHFVVMFAGNLGMVQGLETLVEAARRVQDLPIVVCLVGDGADRARIEGIAQGCTNVRFLGRHPAERMPAFFAAADLLLAHIRPSTVADHAVPTKLLAYLAAGKPILCGMGGAAAELVEESGAGWVVPPGDPEAMANAIRDAFVSSPAAREQRGQSGRAYFEREFDRHAVLAQYEDWLLEEAARHADAS